MRNARPVVIGSLLALFAAAQAGAAVRGCTAAMVSANLCKLNTDRIFSVALPDVDPDGAGPRLSLAERAVEAIALVENYQATVPDPTSPGQVIPNPETKAQFASRILRQRLRDYILRAQELSEEAAKKQRIAADPVPEDIGQ